MDVEHRLTNLKSGKTEFKFGAATCCVTLDKLINFSDRFLHLSEHLRLQPGIIATSQCCED